MSRIGATLFSGGRGAEARLTHAIDFRYAVEYDPQIAAVGAQLGGHTFVSRVEDVDYGLWGTLDYLHASPVCKEYSQAKSGGAEGESDLSSAAAVVRCLEATRPRVFTLENVSAYQHGRAFRRICRALDRAGYMWHYEVVNAADYGVPQTRRRLILRAVLGALLPPLPPPEPWIGWYAAIEDLIDTLPPSHFAPWQLERLPETISGSVMPCYNNTADDRDTGFGMRYADAPSYAVTADSTYGKSRAFIVAGNGNSLGDEDRGSVTDSDAAAPYFTVVSAAYKVAPRAWLIESKNANQQYGTGARRDTEPATTVVTDHKPSHQPKAWLSQGRVVRITPRALARFQSFPDSYILPGKASLACTVIGNAVPSLLMQKIVEPLLT